MSWFGRRRSESAPVRASVLIGLIALLGLLLAVNSISVWQAQRHRVAINAQARETMQVFLALNLVEVGALDALRGQRGFLLTADPLYLTPYRAGINDMQAGMGQLRRLGGAAASRQRQLEELESGLRHYRAALARTIEDNGRARPSPEEAVGLAAQGRSSLAEIRTRLAEIQVSQRATLRGHAAAADQAARRSEWLQYATGLIGLLLLGVAAAAVGALRRAIDQEARAREELRRRAETDELTGLANRRELMAGLHRAISLAHRGERQLSFALIDIDHFKRVNDSFGHPAGDEVIRKVARAALATVRGCDLVGRVGGEEFAIVLPDTGVAQAYAVCERLRERLQSLEIELPGGRATSITLSAGVSRLRQGDTAESLLERADEALYAAKRGGRDQVRLAA